MDRTIAGCVGASDVGTDSRSGRKRGHATYNPISLGVWEDKQMDGNDLESVSNSLTVAVEGK